MSDDKIFADGLIVKVNPNQPEWVLCNLSVKVEEFKAFLDQHQSNGWVNINCKVSQKGKAYAELDTWKPTQGDSAQAGMVQAKQAAAPVDNFIDDSDSIPFSNYQLRTQI